MRSFRLYQVDSFTRQKLLGNPAGVVANADGLSDAEMQAIAREMNLSETAFLLSPSAPTHDVWIRFFTPQSEVPICGHATIAAHYVRAVENSLPESRVMQRTGAGILPVDIFRDGDDYSIVMTQGEIVFGNTLQGDTLRELVEALGLSTDDLRTDCPVQIVSTGHSKVMIGLRSSDQLHSLRPDLQRLSRLSRQIGCNGFYPFTLHPGEPVLVHGRMFAPAIGIAEDPVTGNANGPLGAYLVQHGLLHASGNEAVFSIMQGEAIHRAGTMNVCVRVVDALPVSVQITGQAVIAFSTTLTLPDRP